MVMEKLLRSIRIMRRSNSWLKSSPERERTFGDELVNCGGSRLEPGQRANRFIDLRLRNRRCGEQTYCLAGFGWSIIFIATDLQILCRYVVDDHSSVSVSAAEGAGRTNVYLAQLLLSCVRTNTDYFKGVGTIQ